MDEQELEAALSLFMEQLEEEGGDPHEIFMRLTTLLNRMRAMNLPIPEDLAKLEAELGREFERPAEPDAPSDADR